MAHLDEHKLLLDRQHAFRKKHSCETQLITVMDDWAKILDKGGEVGINFHPDLEYFSSRFGVSAYGRKNSDSG